MQNMRSGRLGGRGAKEEAENMQQLVTACLWLLLGRSCGPRRPEEYRCLWGAAAQALQLRPAHAAPRGRSPRRNLDFAPTAPASDKKRKTNSY